MTDTAARILALLAEQGTPLESFTDSRKPGDLDDMCADLGITLAEAQAAQVELAGAVVAACVECGEAIERDDVHAAHGMCGSCLHDAYRSGWTPGDDN